MESTCVIEINDSGIQLTDADGIQRVSPGFAFYDKRQLLVGEQAAQRMRINPRSGYDRFWSRLDQNPLPQARGAARSHADLAYFHLHDLWQPLANRYRQVLLVTNGGDDEQHLSTLLGIARACAMPVSAIISAPVAAALTSAHAVDDRALVLDAHLHRFSADHIRLAPEHVQLSAAQTACDQGLSFLFKRWAHMIAEAFLTQTRFDPLHNAASEQQLYDALPLWLNELKQHPHVVLKMASGRHRFQIELDRQAFAEAGRECYQALLASAAKAKTLVFIRHRLGLLPGFIEQLRHTGQTVVEINETAIARLLLARQQNFMADDNTEVKHFQHLARDTVGPASSINTDALSDKLATKSHAKQRNMPPTHILYEGRAWPLAGHSWELGINLQAHGADDPAQIVLRQNRHGQTVVDHDGAQALSVNGLNANASQVLNSGDRITVSGREYQLILVMSDASGAGDGAQAA